MRSRFASVAVVLALAGCADAEGARSDDDAVTLTVLAAASLNPVFKEIGESFTKANPAVGFRFSFAGTDSLATQIEQGAPADVFAAASRLYGERLTDAGRIEALATFCTNRLVLVLPAGNPGNIASLGDLTRPGLKLVVGAETVPVGAYTRAVLGKLDALYGGGYSAGALANVVSNEENVEAVLAKVRLGEADAGFVYVTDARAAGTTVLSIELPEEAQAVAQYPIAVVKGTAHPGEARVFVEHVLGPSGQHILSQAGFGPSSP